MAVGPVLLGAALMMGVKLGLVLSRRLTRCANVGGNGACAQESLTLISLTGRRKVPAGGAVSIDSEERAT